MALTVYHLKTCDTCRKAIRALETGGHSLKLVDVRADGVDLTTLTEIMASVGLKAMLNTRSTTWRDLPEVDKENVTESKAIDLMAAHPTLIKRPVIIDGQTMTVGWTPDVKSQYICQDE